MAKLQQDFTQGSVSKHLIKFAMPFLLANLLQALYSVADMLGSLTVIKTSMA